MADRPFDREIARLAVPAFGALLAEPLYVLADTAVVGHLGTAQLGGLAVASAILLAAYSLCIFLAYGTTASVARLLGAGDEREAAHLGVQGLWLAAIVGMSLAVGGLLVSAELVSLFGADGEVAGFALTYFRISLIGMPFLLVSLAGTGYLRGVQDTRSPLVIAVVSSTVNLILELLLVFGLGLGVGASAAATVVVQIGAGLVYIRAVLIPARRLGASVLPDPSTLRMLGPRRRGPHDPHGRASSGVHRRDRDRHPAGQDRGCCPPDQSRDLEPPRPRPRCPGHRGAGHGRPAARCTETRRGAGRVRANAAAGCDRPA